MWLSRLHVRGFADSDPEGLDFELDRVQFSAEPRLLDALALLAGALAEGARSQACSRMRWPDHFQEDELDLGFTAAEIDDSHQPAIVIEADIRPDPPMFGKIREAILRDPERAGGLAEGVLTVRVGWQFTRDRRVVRPDLIGLRLGSVPLPLADLPRWVRPLLREVGGRLRVCAQDPILVVAKRVQAAFLGDVASLRERARLLLTTAGVELVVRDERVMFALQGSLLPIRWGKPGLEEEIGLMEMVLLQQPDVLVVPWELSSKHVAWVEGFTLGEDAVLEQAVFR